MTPAGTSNELDVQNKWEENTHTKHAKNPVFGIVHDESVKIYLHMYNWNVQQNPLCLKSCVTNEFYISFRFSPTIFDLDANSVFLRAHLCTAVDSMRRKPCVRNYSREREGVYNGNVQQNPFPSLPDSRVQLFIAMQIQYSF